MASVSWLKDMFLNNLGLKILALVLALLSFYAVRGATSGEDTYVVPVEVVIHEEGVAVLDQDHTEVKVTFRGSQLDLLQLKGKPLKVVVTPETSNPSGSETITITPRHIKGVRGVRPIKISPNTVTLSFDQEDTRQFPVIKPATIGTPLVGRAEIDYEPHVVMIRGPRRQLERMDSEGMAVETESVDVDERVKSFTKMVRALSPGETWVAQIEPAEIKVTVNIVTESVSREWTNVAVLAVMDRGEMRKVRFEPETVTVSLHGRNEVLNSFTNRIPRVFVYCTELKTSKKHDARVNVHVPIGMDVTAAVTPETVKVIFEKDDN